jgi:hypothetical protein
MDRIAVQSDNGNIVIPLESVNSGRLSFVAGANDLLIHAGGTDDLLWGHFEHPVPQVEAVGGTVQIRYPRFSVSALTGRTVAELWLNSGVPWTIEFNGGLGTVQGDLSELHIKGIDVRGGVRALDLVLPAAADAVPLRLRGGVEQVSLRRPVGTGVRIAVRGGVNELVLDGQHYGPMGGVRGLQTDGASGAGGHYGLTIEGGARSVLVGTV